MTHGGPSRPAHTATLSFTYRSAERARRIERSVRPELGQIADDRSRASVARDDTTLTVTVDAADLVALRAGTNTWVRLVEVAETVGDVAGPAPDAELARDDAES